MHLFKKKMADALDKEPSSFKEAFPKINSGDPIEIYPLKLLEYCNNCIKDNISDVIAMTIKKKITTSGCFSSINLF